MTTGFPTVPPNREIREGDTTVVRAAPVTATERIAAALERIAASLETPSVEGDDCLHPHDQLTRVGGFGARVYECQLCGARVERKGTA